MKVRELMTRVVPPSSEGTLRAPPTTREAAKASFASELKDAERRQYLEPVSLSRHAEQRIMERGIELTVDRLDQIAEAVSTLHGKGATNALLLAQRDAFVVNVPGRIVVTAMGSDEMQDRAFTNIDSAYIIKDQEV